MHVSSRQLLTTCQSALLLKVLVVVVLAVLVLEALVVLVELMVDLGFPHSRDQVAKLFKRQV